MKQLIVISLITIMCMCSQSYGQEQQFSLERLQPIADKALEVLKKLVNDENYLKFGFENLKEVEEATLGEPLRIFTVGLDKLKESDPATDPMKYLDEGSWVIYPVLFEEYVRTAIELEKIKEEWQSTKFGGANLIEMLTSNREMTAKMEDMPLSSFYVVRIAAMNLYFIGYNKDNMLFLSPILEDKGFGLSPGQILPAPETFERIVPAAKAHDGLPR